VTLALRDGSRLQEASDYPRGTPENPLDQRALETKFMALVGDRFGAEFAARARAAASHLASGPNLSETFGALFTVAPPELAV
jgi:2-methylcitrate dehydratase PrpD